MTSAPQQILIAIATYNEIENLPRLVDALFEQVPTADILVVDDNSPDGTGRWCDEKSKQDGRVHCIHRSRKLGLGTATIAAMQYAIDHGYEFLVTMDADFSHDPQDVPALLAAMSPSDGPPLDLCIGSRYVAGGSIEGWGMSRHLMSRGVNAYARHLLGLAPKDCSGAFRCFRTQALAKLSFAEIRSSGYSFQEESLHHLNQHGAQFGEVPIRFRNRQHGRSKISAIEAFAALGIIFRLGIRARLGI